MTCDLVWHAIDLVLPTGSAETLEGLDGCQREDSELLWQVAARAEALLADLQDGHPTNSDLAGLLGNAREVVLARITADAQHDSVPADLPSIVRRLLAQSRTVNDPARRALPWVRRYGPSELVPCRPQSAVARCPPVSHAL